MVSTAAMNCFRGKKLFRLFSILTITFSGPVEDFFAHPFRVLNEISGPPATTSARPRKLGLPDFVGQSRPRTCAFALRDAALGLAGFSRNFIGPLQGRAG